VLVETQTSARGERQLRFVTGRERLPALRNDRRYVWTARSLAAANFSLLTGYAAGFCLLTFGVGCTTLVIQSDRITPTRRTVSA
jgi:hypothetical protein